MREYKDAMEYIENRKSGRCNVKNKPTKRENGRAKRAWLRQQENFKGDEAFEDRKRQQAREIKRD